MSCVEEKFYKLEAVWEYHSLMRIVSGQMRIVLAEDTFIFNAGDTFLIPRNRLSSIIKRGEKGEPFKCILMTFRPDQLKKFYSKQKFDTNLPSFKKIKSYDKHPLLDSLFAALMPYFHLQSDLPDELMRAKLDEGLMILRIIDEKVDGLLSDFSEVGKIDIADFMEKNFIFNLSLENFSVLTGRSISTFNRDFRRAFNISPKKWLMQKRLELAHYKLAEKKLRPVDVYLEVGFENFSHFSYAFKKYFGYPSKCFCTDSTHEAVFRDEKRYYVTDL